MAANVGNQKITLLYHTIANSLEVNKRYVDIRQKGIYKGGWLSIIDDSHAQISPLICEISDTDYQVRAETQDAVNLSVSPGNPYIILRWTYTGSVSDYMELKAVPTPLSYDLVVGKCIFSGSGDLNGFDYGDSLYPRSNPNVQDLFLKVEETGDSDLRVRIRAGRIQTPSGSINIDDQKSDLFVPPTSDSKVYLVYIDMTTGAIAIDSSGTPGANPSPPNYAGKLVLAEVTLASTDTSIPQSKIKDVRNFVSKFTEPDDSTIELNSSGRLQIKNGRPGITFITPRIIYDSGINNTGFVDWTTSDISAYISPVATVAIFDMYGRLSTPDGSTLNKDGVIWLRKDPSSQILEGLRAAARAGEDSISVGHQAMCPVSASGTFQYKIDDGAQGGEHGFNQGARIRLIGYMI